MFGGLTRSSDDFPKPPSAKDDSKAAYARLQQWVKDYFVSPAPGNFDDILIMDIRMKAQRVRQMDRRLTSLCVRVRTAPGEEKLSECRLNSHLFFR